jgi:hypothetical protein
MLTITCLILLGLLCRRAAIASLTSPLTTTEVNASSSPSRGCSAWRCARAGASRADPPFTRKAACSRGGASARTGSVAARRARDSVSTRYVFTVAAPADVVAGVSEPAEPAPQAEQARQDHRRAVSITVLRPLAVDGLADCDARTAQQLAEQAIGLEELHEPSWRLALQSEHALVSESRYSPLQQSGSGT